MPKVSILDFLSTRSFSSIMKAAVVSSFGPPENIQIQSNLPVPQVSQSNEVLVQVHSAGVNPVDTYVRSGLYAALPSLPYTPGRDGSGMVTEVGSSVSHIKSGDRVWFFNSSTGGSAEYAIGTTVFPLPDDLSYDEGVCLGVPYLTAYRALFTKGHAKSGERVLIHGASGGVGLACCQLAEKAGLSVVGTAGTEKGMDIVRKNGAHHVVNHTSKDYVDELKKIAPQGFNLVIEMLANVNLPVDLTLLATGGRVGVVGNRGECTINARLLMMKESSVYGVMLGGISESELIESTSAIYTHFVSSSYRPIINRTYTLEQIPQAHRDVISPPGGSAGNLVVKIR